MKKLLMLLIIGLVGCGTSITYPNGKPINLQGVYSVDEIPINADIQSLRLEFLDQTPDPMTLDGLALLVNQPGKISISVIYHMVTTETVLFRWYDHDPILRDFEWLGDNMEMFMVDVKIDGTWYEDLIFVRD